jgi:hypothetical protein
MSKQRAHARGAGRAQQSLTKIVQPRRTANEMPWEPPFQYECSNGHQLGGSHACCYCPVCEHGQPCDGTLTRVGPGSRPRT